MSNGTDVVSGSVTIARDELYRLVWEKPMVRLGEQFGISGNGLAKICRRLGVPYPPRGWWAKKAAGHKVRQAPLPAPRPGIRMQVTLTPMPPQISGLREDIRQKAERIGAIAIPERLIRPHAIIGGWIADHKGRQAEAKRSRRQWPHSSWSVPDLTEADRRRHRLLNGLFRFLEKHGGEISRDGRGHLFARLCGEKIEFSCHEKSRKVTRLLTEKEKRWETWNRSGVKHDLEPTGRFEFQIRTWTGDYVRKLWLETDRQSFESMLPEIAATFLVLGPLLAERSREREEEARIQAEQQRQLELERQRRQQDDKRWERFLRIAEGWRRTEVAREFIARLRQEDLPEVEPIDGLTVGEWLDWAEGKAGQSDPVGQGTDVIFGDIARIHAWTRFD